MTTERIDIVIREDGSRIVRRNLEDMGTSAKGAEQSIFDLKRTLATLGIGVLIHELARAADEMTTLRSRLLLVSDTVAHARTTFNELYVIAQKTRTSFADLGQTYTSIARAAQSLGIAQTRILRVTETISNAMAIGGGTAESMRAALVQLSQALASNRLGGDEFRSVMEQAPRLAKAIADGLDVTIGKLREMSREGLLTTETVISALESQSSRLSAEIELSTVTLSQGWTRVTNSFKVFLNTMDEATGATKLLTEGLTSIAKMFDVLGETINKHKTLFAGVMGVLAGAAAIAGAVAVAKGIGMIASAVGVLAAVLSAHPAVAILLGVGAVAGGFIASTNAMSKTREGMQKTLRAMERDVNARSIYDERDPESNAKFAATVAERQKAIKALRGEIVLMDNQNLDTRAEDARLERFSLSAQKQEDLKDKLHETRLSINGFDDKFQKYQSELTTYRQAREAGLLTEAEYIKEVTRLAEKYGDAQKNGRSKKGLSQEAKDMKELSEVLNRVNTKEAGVDSTFYKDIDVLRKGYESGKISVDKYRESVLALTSVQKFFKDAARAEKDAIIAAAESNNRAFDEEFEIIEKKRLANEAQIKTAREMLEQIEFETSLIGLNTEQRELAIAMRERERAGIIKGTQAYDAFNDKLQEAIANQRTKQQVSGFWEDFNSTAADVFMDVAMNGEDAFKRIGESIKREVIKMLYEMTIKKWIIQISGQSTLGGSGNSWVDLAQKAYSAYTGGGSAAAAAGSAAAAYGTVNTTTLAGVNAASAGSTGAAGSAAAGSSSSWLTAIGGYAALITVAVAVADNLYSKGYNRQALGAGGSQTVRFGQYSSYSTNPNIQKSQFYDKGILNLEAKNQRALQDALGFSEKWADILSGTTRMATLIGRKLGAYGYEANIAGGNASTSGFARYKGGLFRSNKTVSVDIDQRDAAAFNAVVESTIEGTRAMARAMGYSSEAIDGYTGKLRVNFKGANTAAEQAERMAKAMDDLQYSLLKAAQGGEYSREEFDRLMVSVRASIEAAGITSSGITNTLAQGAIGRMDASEVGAALSESIIGGIYNTIASNAMAPVADAFMAQIITPIFTAIMAGVPISQAVSQVAIDNVVATAQRAGEALNIIFSDPQFQAAINQIGGAISQVSRISTAPARHVRAFGSAVSSVSAAAQKAAEIAQERFGLETTLLNLLGNTAKLRERELAGINASNRALQRQIWTIEDAKEGMESAMDSLQRAVDKQRDLINERLDAANEAESKLNDVFSLLRDSIDSLRGSVASTVLMQAEQARDLIQSAITSGIVPDSDKLSRAIEAVSNSLENQRFASAVERERAFMLAANQQNALLDIVEPQLSAAEQTVSLLESQLTSLDAQLQTAEDQMNALLGIDNSVRTVSVALDMLNASMASYSAAITSAIGVAVLSAAPSAAPSAASASSGSSGGGFSYGGGAASTGWNAAGYWNKNADLREYYIANQNALDAQFGNRDAYLAWHWNNNGKNEKGRRFAMGGAFTNSVVNGPTFFNADQMGEAGPEGILPLANIRGKLGVHASQGNDDETKELLTEILSELKGSRAAGEQTAIYAGRTTQQLKKVIREDRIMTGTPS